jgi:hypothetical protein
MALTWSAAYHMPPSEIGFIKAPMEKLISLVPKSFSDPVTQNAFLASRSGRAYLESSCLRKLIRPITIPAKLYLTFKMVKLWPSIGNLREKELGPAARTGTGASTGTGAGTGWAVWGLPFGRHSIGTGSSAKGGAKSTVRGGKPVPVPVAVHYPKSVREGGVVGGGGRGRGGMFGLRGGGGGERREEKGCGIRRGIEKRHWKDSNQKVVQARTLVRTHAQQQKQEQEEEEQVLDSSWFDYCYRQSQSQSKGYANYSADINFFPGDLEYVPRSLTCVK